MSPNADSTCMVKRGQATAFRSVLETAATSGDRDLVTTGLVLSRGIDLDIAGGKMYYTSPAATSDPIEGTRIQRANLDGSGIRQGFSGLCQHRILR